MTESRNRSRVTLAQVTARRAEIAAIAARHHVSNVRVFGSVARGTADEFSDLDLLVDAASDVGLIGLSAFAAEVEDLLGAPTQVATVGGLKQRIRTRVLREAVAV